MTTREMLHYDPDMQEEEFFVIGYYKWLDYEPHAFIASDKDKQIVKLRDKETAERNAMSLAKSSCKQDCENNSVFCTVVVRIRIGGGKEPEGEEVTKYFLKDGNVIAQVTRDEAIQGMVNVYQQRGVLEV